MAPAPGAAARAGRAVFSVHEPVAKGEAVSNYHNLTERQKEIYDFIREKIETRGYGPTVREIGTQFEIKSPNGVMCHLNALVKKGLILRTERSARAIQLVDHRGPGYQAELPLCGEVAAGTPIAAIPTDERLNLGELFNGPDHIALKVRGQSMIEDHIDDGDYVVIRKQGAAENGERVVAMIDGEMTLKRYQTRKGGRVVLLPANSEMGPIEVDKPDSTIFGVLVGVLRKC
jgi:repressor LexA